jgi:hypothetical protein
MGQSSEEDIKMKYVYFSEPLTDREHFHFMTKYANKLSDWQRDYDDFDKLFKDDPVDKRLRGLAKSAKKNRDANRELKRKENNKK